MLPGNYAIDDGIEEALDDLNLLRFERGRPWFFFLFWL